MVEFDDNLNPINEGSAPTPPTPAAPQAVPPMMPPPSFAPPPPRPSQRPAMFWGPNSLLIVILVGVILAGSILVSTLTHQKPGTNPYTGQPEGLNVQAEGVVYATPDIAKIMLGVQKDGATVNEVKDELAKTTTAIKSSLTEQGILDKDIQTTDYSIYPQYAAPGNRITGYTARHTLTVTAHDLDKVDGLTDKALAAGANEVNGVYFTVEDTEKWWQEARTQALSKAKDKAKKMAEAADVKLGRVISINEWTNQPGGPIPYATDGYGGTGGMPVIDKSTLQPGIEPGNLEMHVNVNIVYAIR